MSYGSLTASLLARQTTMLVVRQIMDDERPFLGIVDRLYNPADLDGMLDDFSIKYLEEMADTAANINWLVERVPLLEIPPSVACGRATFRGVTVRLIMAHDIWNDCHRLRIDVTWSPP